MKEYQIFIPDAQLPITIIGDDDRFLSSEIYIFNKSKLVFYSTMKVTILITEIKIKRENDPNP